jgi:N-acetylmuramoyl-L-alanine amidase
MATFISAGHHLKDSGAIGSGTQENLETIKFRDIVIKLCKDMGLKVITDDDHETLKEYLDRIKTGDGSVVVEFHFDASGGGATGTTCLVGSDADRLDKSFAQELVNATSAVLKIKNRGVISESQSHRGRLGLMREQGIVALLEICFIDNLSDMTAYRSNTYELASKVAAIIQKYEKMIV